MFLFKRHHHNNIVIIIIVLVVIVVVIVIIIIIITDSDKWFLIKSLKRTVLIFFPLSSYLPSILPSLTSYLPSINPWTLQRTQSLLLALQEGTEGDDDPRSSVGHSVHLLFLHAGWKSFLQEGLPGARGAHQLSAGWSVDWSVDWLIDRLIDWMLGYADWLVY